MLEVPASEARCEDVADRLGLAGHPPGDGGHAASDAQLQLDLEDGLVVSNVSVSQKPVNVTLALSETSGELGRLVVELRWEGHSSALEFPDGV